LASAGSRPSARKQAADVECGVVDPGNLCCGIEPAQPRDERNLRFLRLCLIDQIELGDEDLVSQRDLTYRFDVIVERAGAVHRIDGRDHNADAIEPASTGSDKKAWISGDGSARPDVSITTWSKRGISPASRE